MKRISESPTKYDLQDVYYNLSKGYGRNLTSWRRKRWIRAFLAPILWNRRSLLTRKMIEVIRLARNSSKCENHEVAIVVQGMNSPWSWCLCHEFTKTDVEQGLWKMNQKESSNFMKKWWRNLEKCWWSFWENLENGGKVCYDSWELQLWLTFCYD
jgi:hypothetical protein